MNKRKTSGKHGKHNMRQNHNKKSNKKIAREFNDKARKKLESMDDIVNPVRADDNNDSLVQYTKQVYTKDELEEMIRVIKENAREERIERRQDKRKSRRKVKNKAEQPKHEKVVRKKKEKLGARRGKKKKKKISIKNVILTIIQIILVGAIIYSGWYICKWYKDNKENDSIKEELQDIIIDHPIQTSDTALNANDYNIDFAKLLETNKDSVAWIKVNNTDIEYPIVKARNNDYYLNRSFNGNYNGAGWIFADFRNKFDGNDKNIIAYGHNRKDGSMFGTLKDTLQPEWYTNPANKNIVFITADEKSNYEVFSNYMIATEDYYITTSFGKGEFQNFVNVLKRRSVYDYGVEVGEDDSIITLSTCAGNDYRTVLHAKKVIEATEE